jgi:hypothetical protein
MKLVEIGPNSPVPSLTPSDESSMGSRAKQTERSEKGTAYVSDAGTNIGSHASKWPANDLPKTSLWAVSFKDAKGYIIQSCTLPSDNTVRAPPAQVSLFAEELSLILPEENDSERTGFMSKVKDYAKYLPQFDKLTVVDQPDSVRAADSEAFLVFLWVDGDV